MLTPLFLPAMVVMAAPQTPAAAPDAARLAQDIAASWKSPDPAAFARKESLASVASITARIFQEKDPAVREVLLVTRLHQSRKDQEASRKEASGKGAAAVVASWSEAFAFEAAKTLSPDSPAFTLLLADPSLVLDLAWYRSGGGYVAQSPDEAARKAFAFLDEVAARHPDPQVKALALASGADLWTRPGNIEGVQGYVNRLEALDPKDPRIAGFRSWIEKARHERAHPALEVGKPVPSFRVPDLAKTGHDFTQASFKGKYLLIDFWATWCAPCRRELPFLHKAYAKFHGRGLEILSLSRDRKASDIAAFRKLPETPMPWNHSFPQGKAADSLMNAFGVKGIPHIVLVGPDGRVLEVPGEALRGERLEQTLGKYLKP